jgi:hypothetical protein
LRGIAAATAAAGLIFRIGGLAENDLVSIGSRQVDQSLAVDPSGNGLAFGLRIVFVRVLPRFPEDRFYVSPVAAGFDDDEFVSAAGHAEFGGIVGGRDANGLLVD